MKYLRLACLLCAFALCLSLCSCGSSASAQSSSLPPQDFTQVPSADGAADADKDKLKYRAMWISYLDWNSVFDTSDAAAFEASAAAAFDKCVQTGINCVIVQVRPFADAVYPSEYFPWSSFVTGTQGTAPNYDPLKILVDTAHAKGLAFEAWVNPYRVRLNDKTPQELAGSNPAVLHPEWVETVDGGMYFNPAIPEVQTLIINGVSELVRNYDVDGIQFDDYFYPTQDASFDEAEYLLYADGKPLDEWRRSNVNSLVSGVYKAIKAEKPSVIFGISPQGNNDNNYNSQYSDVAMWMSTEGYVDYIMPQIYWGFGYKTSGGSDRYAFKNILNEWASMPRLDSVSLTIGLGAYRIGAGDGGSNDQSEWSSGHNLKDMTDAIDEAEGIDGFALFRYEFLYSNTSSSELALKESTALAEKYAQSN